MKRQWMVWSIVLMLCLMLSGYSLNAQLQEVDSLRVIVRAEDDSADEHQLYVYDIRTDTLTPLTPIYEDRVICVSISPDNSQVVYKTTSRTRSDRLYVVDIDAGDIREVDVRDFISCAKWSPDGTSFVYSIRRSFEEYVVYSYDVTTRARREVLPVDTDTPPLLEWQPEGRYLLINDRDDLYSYDLSQATLNNLTSNEDNEEQFFNWSPVGQYISYGLGGRRFQNALFVVDVESTLAQNITSNVGTAFGGTYWSPDGTQIAFERVTSRPRSLFDAIFVYDITQQAIVTDIVADGQNNYINEPRWSPDSTAFVYRQFDVVDFTTDLLLYDVASNSVRPLTNTPDLAEDFTRWSPDGTQIAFIGFVVDNPGRTKRVTTAPDRQQLTVDIGEPDTYIYDFATDATIQLTDTPNLIDIEVHWSPDGEYLVVRTLRPGSSEESDLYLVNVTTGEIRTITDFAGEETFIGWLPR